MPDRETRRDQRLRRCDRLAEMAMHLTETAYTQALRDAQPPPDRPRSSPGAHPTYMPPRTDTAYANTLASQFFQEFSRCARQAILLEARLDSGAYDNAPALPIFAERASTPHETTRDAPSRPRQPSDETRIHHEHLEDEFFADDLGGPDEILQIIRENLSAAIAHTRAAGLDSSRGAPPRATNAPAPLETPEPARPATPPRPAAPAATQTQARPRASPPR